ncbi:MAG: hypothetical protein JXA95_06190 [Spirochaetales bacterium]|nr:hypothetical protein [Spirochaetales bacterium]
MKSKLSYVVTEKILLDENDPYRFKHARDVIMNASRDEYNKHYIEMDEMRERIEAEYTQIEKEAFLAKYGKTKVAFTEKSCYLFIMNLDGTEKEQPTSFSFDGEDLFLKFIRWSPDGKYIVCNHALRNLY